MKALKTVTVTWSWLGDPFALRGFNIAITPTGTDVHPDTHAVVRGFAGPGATSYTFSNVALDRDTTYQAWVQAVYEGGDSDWVNASGVAVSDDGTATIPPAYSNTTGARWELEPDQYFRIYDDAGNIIFEATLSGTNVGDVRIGSGTKYVKWDKSAGTLDIVGTLQIGSYINTTPAETVEQNAADGAAAWAKFSGVGNTLPAGNVEFNFAGSTSKGGNAINTDNVGSQSASAVATAVVNFNNRNDRDGSAITAPTVATDGTAVDHTINTDGSANISFEWSWSSNESSIDGWMVYVYQSTSSASYSFGTDPAGEQVFYLPADRRALILYGVPADQYYTFGVRAYRIVDPDVNSNGVILSTLVKATATGENPYRPSSNVAFTGDVTGTVAGTAAATVRDNADAGAAAKAKIDTEVGTDTIETTAGAQQKANTAEANAKAASEPRVTKSATAPSSPNTDDLWLDTSVTPHVWKRWNGTAWVKATPTEADEIAESATRKWAAESGADKTQTVMNAGVEITASGGNIRAGKTGFSDTANVGWFIGRDAEDGLPKLRVGNNTHELVWDGSALTVKGTLHVQPGSTGYDNLSDKPPLAQSLWVPADGELFEFREHFSSTKGVSPL